MWSDKRCGDCRASPDGGAHRQLSQIIWRKNVVRHPTEDRWRLRQAGPDTPDSDRSLPQRLHLTLDAARRGHAPVVTEFAAEGLAGLMTSLGVERHGAATIRQLWRSSPERRSPRRPAATASPARQCTVGSGKYEKERVSRAGRPFPPAAVPAPCS